ncbi:amino acid ABC transporter permease [Arthrobacter cryoconiti]|uniref:Amino acid ABC transporter permease n=1 Tax=Arthrobacter cryoconiti TaxID=748907 RepID=A0ABV8QYN1_9MICC|nr:amino acid ABC transporter permease [Arthrobacter cryoconiti]MCC9067450.1 amino acid ABC transporter permease [Arthrobacter cryoconiti]
MSATTNESSSDVASGDGIDRTLLLGRPHRRHGLQWLTAGIVLFVIFMVAYSLVTNPRFEWDVVFGWFASERLFSGLIRTLELTAISMVVGILVGIILALARLAPNFVIAGVASFFVWFFRGVPVFVQLLFWGFIAAIYPRISLGIPFGPEFFSVDANVLITPFLAAILGLGLNEGAYMSEIVRAGLLSVNRGQTEAAKALGMRRLTILWRIVLPQAMKVIIPPTGNQTISMLKTTSLVSVLAFPELLYSAQLVYSANFKTIPLLIAASLWYLLVTSVLSLGQYYIERHYNRGSGKQQKKSILTRFMTKARSQTLTPGEQP